MGYVESQIPPWVFKRLAAKAEKDKTQVPSTPPRQVKSSEVPEDKLSQVKSSEVPEDSEVPFGLITSPTPKGKSSIEPSRQEERTLPIAELSREHLLRTEELEDTYEQPSEAQLDQLPKESEIIETKDGAILK